MKSLLDKIASIAVINEEIITRIEAKQNGKVKTYHYGVKSKEDCTLLLTEYLLETTAQTIIDKWTPQYEMEAYDDVFNDKINISGSSFAHQKRLNREFAKVALKFHLFGESEAAIPKLEPFKTNLGHITANLGSLETKLADDVSTKHQLLTQIKKANYSIRKALLPASISVGIPKAALLSTAILNAGEAALVRQLLPAAIPHSSYKSVHIASKDGWELATNVSWMSGGFLILLRTREGMLIGVYSPSLTIQPHTRQYPQFGSVPNTRNSCIIIIVREAPKVSQRLFSQVPTVLHFPFVFRIGHVFEFRNKSLVLSLARPDFELDRQNFEVVEFELFSIKK
eukprot:TRINITY_DN6173_c0_g1_i1.p1 TRINITY_DN6173_c0_g1~~TRINITY_DN6173_c0_g1_i1.p1  ORF type:complete len:340 (+),score=53.09 TRINITY_DN6173_c0_g1_i1:39-1058(+)